MINETTLAVGGSIVTVLAVAVYAYKTGNEASVDFDDDGNNEVTFNNDGGVSEDSSTEEATSETTSNVDETEAELDIPNDVQDRELVDVKGVGPTKAEHLNNEGYENANDLYFAADSNLTDVTGIGSGVLGQIRDDIGSWDADAEADTE